MSRSDKIDKVTLTIGDKTLELPVIHGAEGPSVIDVRKLYGETGMFTYDPGFTSTASCDSSITYIDGEEGILRHRGYPIDDLAMNSDFMEVAYLLFYGDLPNQREKEKFSSDITYHTMVHEQLLNFFHGFRRDAHPMAILCGVVGALSAFYHDSTDINDPHQRMVATYRMVAKMPTIAARRHHGPGPKGLRYQRQYRRTGWRPTSPTDALSMWRHFVRDRHAG